MALLARLGVLTIDEASRLNDQQVSLLVESVNYELVQYALSDAKVQAHLQAKLKDTLGGLAHLKLAANPGSDKR